METLEVNDGGVIEVGEQHMEGMFDWAGLSAIYDNHGFKMWLDGFEQKVDTELLDRFSDAYSFEDAEAMYYDEFLYHLRIFRYISKNNDLPPRYW